MIKGRPMYDRAAERKRVIVTIERGDAVVYRMWRGWRVASIRRAARAKYPDARLSFGKWF